MNDELRKQVALFKYGIISPLISGHVVRQEYLEKVCETTHNMPHYGTRQLKYKTILDWLRTYNRGGFEALMPKVRNDSGNSRKLSQDTLEEILSIRDEHPLLPIQVFYNHLVKTGVITEVDLSYNSLTRYLKKHRTKVVTNTTERKRFAYDKINVLWQGDLSFGPFIKEDGKARQAYLIAYIDDCSRLITHAQFFYEQGFDSLRTVTKQAILRYGKPKIIYVDNGKIYTSEVLQYACAKLNISLVNTKPYDPQSKGKIERFFLTVQKSFYPTLQLNPVESIEQLNKRFWEWLEVEYHRKPHSSLEKQTPHEVFTSQLGRMECVDDVSSLDYIFLKRVIRKVSTGGTISYENKLYEVPQKYIGHKIDIRIGDKEMKVYENDAPVANVVPVNMNDNAHVKRVSPFSVAVEVRHV